MATIASNRIRTTRGLRAARGARSGRPVRSAGAVPVGLRLTPRGRAVLRVLAATAVTAVAAAVLTAIVAVAVLLGGGSAQGGERVTPVVAGYHVVQPGETIWGLAEQLRPGADPRDTVAQIVALNELPSARVSVGTRLALPAVG